MLTRRGVSHSAWILRAGKLGRVGYVENYGYFPPEYGRNPRDVAPPATLDYELWTGPAPMRPYNELTHPRNWRAFMEYGNGTIGDIGIHTLDIVRRMLGLGAPRRISSVGRVFVEPGGEVNITLEWDDEKGSWSATRRPTASGGARTAPRGCTPSRPSRRLYRLTR